MLSIAVARNRYTFFIDDEQRAALAFIKERDGISESEQIRRAIKAWVELKTGTAKTERPRAATRKRS
jgi:hypothetical protein